MPTPLNQKPPMAAWIVRERKRLQLKPRDIVERLAAQGLTVSEATVKVWESNADRRPSPENIEGLERIFKSQAPGRDAVDMTLTGAINELVAELRASREERESLDARLRAVEAELESLRARPTGGGSPARSAPLGTTG
jgi:hypothetical protein